MANFLISTTTLLDGYNIEKYLGIVNTNIVIGTNFFSDFAASFTDVFGGNSETYQRKMDAMYQEAKKELIDKVKNLGGNAIIGFRTDFDEISGKGKSMFMLSAVGTACKISSFQSNISNEINTSVVDSFMLQNEITRIDIGRTLQKKKYTNLTEDMWQYLMEYPSKDIASLIVSKFYYTYNETYQNKVESLISRLDFDDAVSIVYPNYVSEKIENCIEPGTTFETGGTKDYSYIYLNIIKNCKLFSPADILSLIDVNINKAVQLLECGKQTYSKKDLEVMKAICEKLDNLPEIGEKTVGKTGLFSKEKDIWICPNNHKNDAERKFCLDCGVDIKGLKKGDYNRIEAFKEKTKALANLLS